MKNPKKILKILKLMKNGNITIGDAHLLITGEELPKLSIPTMGKTPQSDGFELPKLRMGKKDETPQGDGFYSGEYDE